MTGTKVTIELRRGYPVILNNDPGVRAVLHIRAQAAALIAKGTAPVNTGDYKNSIKVREDLKGVSLVATDFKANWIEFGTVHTRAFATLRNAARKVATRLIEH